MVRNGILLLILMVCALSLVTSRHQARKLFVEQERGKQLAHYYDVEYDKLQLELSTWSVPTRIDRLARNELSMQLPEPKRIQIVEVSADALFSRSRHPSGSEGENSGEGAGQPADEKQTMNESKVTEKAMEPAKSPEAKTKASKPRRTGGAK